MIDTKSEARLKAQIWSYMLKSANQNAVSYGLQMKDV